LCAGNIATRQLQEYGFQNFKNYNLLTKGQVIEEVNVWLGNAPKTPLVLSEDLQRIFTKTGACLISIAIWGQKLDFTLKQPPSF